jgi:hypothetical protein
MRPGRSRSLNPIRTGSATKEASATAFEAALHHVVQVVQVVRDRVSPLCPQCDLLDTVGTIVS